MGALARFGRVEVGDGEFRRALAVQRLLADRGLRARLVPDPGQAARWIVPAGSLP